MKERFKRYLEREFRAIPATAASMEYRQKMLKQLMDRSEDLRLKGMTDDELIYDMVIDELGDFRTKLLAFSNKANKTEQQKRQAMFFTVFIATCAFLLVVVYLIVSSVTHQWGKTWLILVEGILAGLVLACGVFTVIGFSKKRRVVPHIATTVGIVLSTVFVFLLLQIVAKVPQSYLAFLVMVMAMFAAETAISFATNSKAKYFELGAMMEVECVMLYVILGLTLPGSFWHPGWILCLAGVVGIFIEVIALIVRRNSGNKAALKGRTPEEIAKQKEEYYTKWTD